VDDHHLSNKTKLKEKKHWRGIVQEGEGRNVSVSSPKATTTKKRWMRGKWNDIKVKKKTYPSQCQACKV
jgi:hypothetical protein